MAEPATVAGQPNLRKKKVLLDSGVRPTHWSKRMQSVEDPFVTQISPNFTILHFFNKYEILMNFIYFLECWKYLFAFFWNLN